MSDEIIIEYTVMLVVSKYLGKVLTVKYLYTGYADN